MRGAVFGNVWLFCTWLDMSAWACLSTQVDLGPMFAGVPLFHLIRSYPPSVQHLCRAGCLSANEAATASNVIRHAPSPASIAVTSQPASQPASPGSSAAPGVASDWPPAFPLHMSKQSTRCLRLSFCPPSATRVVTRLVQLSCFRLKHAESLAKYSFPSLIRPTRLLEQPGRLSLSRARKRNL